MNAPDVALQLNLKRHPRSWRGDCPSCAYPGAFALKDGKGGRALLYCSNGCDRATLRHAIEGRVGPTWTPPPLPDRAAAEATKERNRATSERLWLGSEAAPGTPTASYLASRGLVGLEHSHALRWRGDCTHPEQGGRWSAMVARVLDVQGQHIGCHRTYLRRDGLGKADVAPNKASLGSVWGGAVRLQPPRDESEAPGLVVGEGIESAASAGALMGLPAWAALSAGNLRLGLILPPTVRFVVIAADHDLPARNGAHPGQEAAQGAANRWRAGGRTVHICTPDRPGADFNDVLRERAAHG